MGRIEYIYLLMICCFKVFYVYFQTLYTHTLTSRYNIMAFYYLYRSLRCGKNTRIFYWLRLNGRLFQYFPICCYLPVDCRQCAM